MPQEDGSKTWLDIIAGIRDLIREVGIVVAAIGAIVTSVMVYKHGKVQEQTKDIVTETRVDAKKVVVNALGDPQDKVELNKLETTQPSK